MKKGKKSKYIMYMQNLKAQDQIIEKRGMDKD